MAEKTMQEVSQHRTTHTRRTIQPPLPPTLPRIQVGSSDSSSVCFVLATCHATSETRVPRYPDPVRRCIDGGGGEEAQLGKRGQMTKFSCGTTLGVGSGESQTAHAVMDADDVEKSSQGGGLSQPSPSTVVSEPCLTLRRLGTSLTK